MTRDIERIYQQFLDGCCPREDTIRLLEYFKTEPGHADMVALIERELDKPVSAAENEPVEGFSGELELESLHRRIGFPTVKIRRVRRWLPYTAAAILAAAVGAWLLFGDQINLTSEFVNQKPADIAPGGNRATLTLADGSVIDLSEEQEGIIISNDNITYSDGSKEIVNLQSKIGNLSVSTPKGGTYQLTLPDGSKVWLNAASTLHYVSHFSDTDRVVEVTGEAYFSITKDEHKPFKVVTAGQEIQVLGTEFNVSAYAEDDEIKTTLVNGSVRVKPTIGYHQSPITIKPGGQVTTRGTAVDVREVDTELYTAWKDGYFYFKKTPLDDILRQAARWYDIDIVYIKGIPKETFSGDIKRDVSLRGLLEILQLSTINATLEGRTLIVHK